MPKYTKYLEFSQKERTAMSYRLKHLRKRKKPGMRIIYITKN